MKVLHLSTADANGGAARGAYWMHKALCSAGVDSHMLVADKFTSDRTVIGASDITGSQKVAKGIRQTIEYWPLKRYKNKQPGPFSPAIYPSRIAAQVEAIDPDIINLHWVSGGLLRPQDLRRFQRTRPRHLVWTLRDMWAFTGGCHYSGDCTAYQTGCGRCPLLGSHSSRDLSSHIWQRKQAAWKDLNITIVPLSHWLADCAKQSKLFAHQPIQVIPNAIDAEVYRPIDKAIARNLFNLSQHKKLILFGALNPTTDPRKGFRHLRSALHHLALQSHHDQIEAVIFGIDKPDEDLNLKLPTTFLGRLHDDIALVLAYSAADVMVMPSVHDNFAKTTIEAMACGTPVVGFNAKGFKDCVVHQQNGYAATCFDTVDLANGISWVLEDCIKPNTQGFQDEASLIQTCSQTRWQMLSKNARQTVEDKFTVTRQAKQYQALYQKLMTSSENADHREFGFPLLHSLKNQTQ
jgi:glycosyltransferase involved in cell wall biosynthesis